jgi:hypothetical protein
MNPRILLDAVALLQPEEAVDPGTAGRQPVFHEDAWLEDSHVGYRVCRLQRRLWATLMFAEPQALRRLLLRRISAQYSPDRARLAGFYHMKQAGKDSRGNPTIDTRWLRYYFD